MTQWTIPLSDISFDNNEIDAVVAVLRSGWLSMGEITTQFERAMAELLGVKYSFAVANGTAALHLAYLSLDIGLGDEVILPSLSFAATANAAIYTGATPVFAEISSYNNLNISPLDIERRITSRTRAITVMHYAGYPCQMESILDIARRHGVAVIEDSAHAPGAMCLGKMAGAIGDVGCFSFFANKNLVTGEGGMVVTNHEQVANRIRLLRSHGMTSLTWDRHQGHSFSYDITELGYNYRLDEIRSAIGLSQLDKLASNNLRRRQITEDYRLELCAVPDLIIPFSNSNVEAAHHLFVILLPENAEREQFIGYMKSAGIQTSIHYPPIHLFQYYRKKYGFREGLLPLTESASARLVTLPLFPTMSKEQVGYVSTRVKDFFR